MISSDSWIGPMLNEPKESAMVPRSTCRGFSGQGIGRRAFLATTVAAGGAGLSLPTLLEHEGRHKAPTGAQRRRATV